MKTMVAVIFAVLTALARCETTLVVQEVFKDGRFDVVDNATKVEACILSIRDPSGGKDLKRRVYIEGPFKKLPEEVRTLVVWKLLEDTNYTWNLVPACWPTYNCRLRFSTEGRLVVVDICFSCSQLIVVESGVVVGAGYFSPGSDWIFKALATQFPNSSVIKEIKKGREDAEVHRLQVEIAKACDARKGRLIRR